MTSSFSAGNAIRLFLVASAVALLSCGGETEEGEIVIRAEDIALEDSTGTLPLQGDSTVVHHLDSLMVHADSILLPDSVMLVPDTLLSDTIPASTGEDSLPYPVQLIAVELSGSIYGSLQDEVENADIAGAHIVRCMWWDTDPWNGMCAGDSIYVLLGATGRENQVVALNYVPVPGSANPQFSVYNFRMTGDNFPSHYYSDGEEVMRLLDYMPLTTFEEMTGPYGEPRGDHTHAGVDFKAPEGTPVRTCRGGTVNRVNWNSDYNGNCVSVSIGGGYSEIFLHLHSVAGGVTPGVVLQKGDVVGYVGNTGRTSTATHLHYQINDERGNTIDPYLFYSSHRRSLPQGDMAGFESFRLVCDRLMRGDI